MPVMIDRDKDVGKRLEYSSCLILVEVVSRFVADGWESAVTGANAVTGLNVENEVVMIVKVAGIRVKSRSECFVLVRTPGCLLLQLLL